MGTSLLCMIAFGAFVLVVVVMAAPALYQFLWGDFADERKAAAYIERLTSEKPKRKRKNEEL